jgi:hypothetical protein
VTSFPFDLPIYRKMNEILAKRDEIRRTSQERVMRGLPPFPSVEEVEMQQRMRNQAHTKLPASYYREHG